MARSDGRERFRLTVGRIAAVTAWSLALTAAASAQTAAAGAGSTAPPAQAAADTSPRVEFSRAFPRSQPAYFEIQVAEDGRASYTAREADGQPEQTLHCTADPALVKRIFSLADAAHDFALPLEARNSHVGFTGTKTLRYVDGSQTQAQQYNFSTLHPVQELEDLFDAIAATGEDALALERTARFDRLGVNDEIDQIQQDWQRKHLAAPELLLPVLEQVAADPAMMEVDRKRARQLAAAMNPRP